MVTSGDSERGNGGRQARRDAVTVEIGFAVVTGALLAGALFCLLGAPVLLFPSMAEGARHGLLLAASAAAAVGFLGRVVRVLWRFPGTAEAAPQPSRPGRTSPDS